MYKRVHLGACPHLASPRCLLIHLALPAFWLRFTAARDPGRGAAPCSGQKAAPGPRQLPVGVIYGQPPGRAAAPDGLSAPPAASSGGGQAAAPPCNQPVKGGPSPIHGFLLSGFEENEVFWLSTRKQHRGADALVKCLGMLRGEVLHEQGAALPGQGPWRSPEVARGHGTGLVVTSREHRGEPREIQNM